MPDRPELDTRTRMIVSATELFRENGYSGTGFRDVVAHSGAPRGSTRTKTSAGSPAWTERTA